MAGDGAYKITAAADLAAWVSSGPVFDPRALASAPGAAAPDAAPRRLQATADGSDAASAVHASGSASEAEGQRVAGVDGRNERSPDNDAA